MRSRKEGRGGEEGGKRGGGVEGPVRYSISASCRLHLNENPLARFVLFQAVAALRLSPSVTQTRVGCEDVNFVLSPSPEL